MRKEKLMSETLKEVVEQEDESQIVAHDDHDDYYDSRSIIPADNVDADGVPWATVGENIRNGKKNYGINFLASLFSDIFGVEMQIVDVEINMTQDIISTNIPTIETTKTGIIPPQPFAILGVKYPNDSTVNDQSIINYYYGLQGYPAFINVKSSGHLYDKTLTLTLLMKK